MKNILTIVLLLIANIGYAAVLKAAHSEIESENRVYKSVAASGWSEKNKNRVDPYAPKAEGPGTLDEWCNSPHVHDPACMANAVAMPLQQEIDAVMQHMICLLRPEKCDGAAGEEISEEQSSKDKDSASKKANGVTQKINDLTVGSEPKSRGKSDETTKKQGSEAKLGGKSETKASASANNSASAKASANAEAKAGANVESKAAKAGANAEAKAGANAESKADDNSWNLKKLRAKAKSSVGNSDTSFKKYDKDGDGVMTWNEFELECDSLGVEKQADCKQIFEEMSKGKATASEEDYKDAMGPTSEDDNSWNLEKLRGKANHSVGDSDASFKKYDKDGNGVMTWQEFELECDALGVKNEADCKKMFEQMSEGKETVSEEDYKDAMGATSEEVARRLRKKFSSSAEAFDAVDSDNDGLVSDWEFYEECSNSADPVDCENLQKKLGPGTAISKEAFDTWMETGHLPSGAKVPFGIAGGAPAPAPAMAPSPAMAPLLGDTSTASATASTNLLGLVDKLENITNKLAQDNELDPELQNTLERMIDTGRDAARSLHEMSSLSPEEASVKLDKMVEKAESLDEAVFKFQTEVHPHGYKWWRYRWEYAFVEANILNLLVFVSMLLYMVLHWLTDYMSRFRADAGVLQKSSIVHLYHSIFARCMDEANVLGLIAFLIWALEECGLFVFLVEFLPDNPIVAIVHITHKMTLSSSEAQDPHWPTTDQHIIYTLRTVNMHLFLGMLFYYMVMYNITLGAQCTLEQFMKHESRDFYDRFVGSQTGSDVHEIAEVDEATKLKAQAAHTILSDKWWLSKTLSSDETFKCTFGCFYEDEQFDAFRNYVSEHVQYHEGFEELYKLIPEIPLYPYLGIKLHDQLAKLIVIRWPVWILVQAVLVLQACGHYFWHVAAVEILPFSIAVAFCILAWQYIWTRRRVHYVVDPANQVSSQDEGRTSEELKARERGETWVLWIQQLNVFFLCFSAARFLFSSFFWTDYFRLSCCMLVLFLGIYLLFLFVGSLTIPMFIIMHSVPPHVTREDREDLLKVVVRHAPNSARQTRGNLVRGDLRRCSTTYVIP